MSDLGVLGTDPKILVVYIMHVWQMASVQPDRDDNLGYTLGLQVFRGKFLSTSPKYLGLLLCSCPRVSFYDFNSFVEIVTVVYLEPFT